MAATIIHNNENVLKIAPPGVNPSDIVPNASQYTLTEISDADWDWIAQGNGFSFDGTTFTQEPAITVDRVLENWREDIDRYITYLQEKVVMHPVNQPDANNALNILQGLDRDTLPTVNHHIEKILAEAGTPIRPYISYK